MRFYKGIKAEDEIKDFVRRARNGRLEKALGNAEQGIPQQVVGTGHHLYGYTFVYNTKGVQMGYSLNYDVIFTDENGKTWTQVTVVIFIFESVANGISVHETCKTLNRMRIPTPFIAKGLRRRNMKEQQFWHPQVVNRIIKNSAYYGEYRYGKTASLGRLPGFRAPGRRRPDERGQS